MPRTLRDFLIAVSLSNLCFSWAWQTLANPLHYSYYYIKGPRSVTEPIALLLDELIVAAIFWVSIQLARRSGYRLPMLGARWIFLLLLAVPLYSILHKREADSVRSEFDLPIAALIIIAVILILILLAAHKWHRQVIKVAVACVLIVAPLVVINFGYSLWLLNKHQSQTTPAPGDYPTTPTAKNGRTPHIVWIVFDELDHYFTFDQRPPGLNLPELDRLRSESLFASNAYPPTGQTLYSMPALITGKRVVGGSPLSSTELQLHFDDQTVAGWSTVRNVFSEARASGFTTALVGWYHPYCRVIGSNIDYCAWEPLYDRSDPDTPLRLLRRNMLFWARQTVFRVPLLRIVKNARDRDQRDEHIAAYQGILNDALRLAPDPKWNLILVHLPIPHHPWIYDSRAKQLSSAYGHSYADNVLLADETIGQMRRAIETTGLWHDSTVLVSSDHWWRERPRTSTPSDHRVPFILKLPGLEKGMVYERPMNTLVTKELLLKILRGELAKPEDVSAWLDYQPADVKVYIGPHVP